MNWASVNQFPQDRAMSNNNLSVAILTTEIDKGERKPGGIYSRWTRTNHMLVAYQGSSGKVGFSQLKLSTCASGKRHWDRPASRGSAKSVNTNCVSMISSSSKLSS